MQILYPEMRNLPAANRAAIHILEDALTTPENITAEPATLQARRLAKLFFLFTLRSGDDCAPCLRWRAMTLYQQSRAGFIELAPLVEGFGALWHVGAAVTIVAEGDDFEEILERGESWARSEGVPLVRGLQH